MIGGEQLEGSLGRLKTVLKQGGPWYAALFVCRVIADRMRDRFDDRLATIERKRNLIEPWTISARRFTADDMRKLYNTYDWSTRGDQWTLSEAWKQGLLEDFMFPNLPEGGVLVEIGPGAGRWTEILQKRAKRVVATDVAEHSLATCRQRFHDCTNIDFLLGDGRTIAVPDASVDGVWSYDVFVHINPIDARGYFREFARIMKRGSRAVIHHPGPERINPSRSDLTDRMVRGFCAEAGLRVVLQTGKYAAEKNPGDLLSVIEKL